MTFAFKGYLIDYDYNYFEHNATLVLLHGWGGNKSSFLNLDKFFNKKYNILKISIPPYFTSKNKLSKSIIPLTLDDYKEILLTIFKLHNIKTIVIVCHSFGFRLSLILSSSHIKINKIVVTGGAGISFRRSIFKTLNLNSKILFSKHKILNLKNDYSILNDIDKVTFKNIVNKNLINYTKLINCPICLFWGKQDKDSRIKICKYLKKTNKNSVSKIVNSDHFAYLKHYQEFVHICINFLK